MVKRIAIASIVAGTFAAAPMAQGQPTGACMVTLMDSIVTALGMSDSFTVTGTCDSAVASRQVGTFKLPVATLKKQDSCSYSISIIGFMDTVINSCALEARTSPAFMSPGDLRISFTGSCLVLDGKALPAGAIAIRLFDDRGRCVETFTSPGGSDVSWSLAGRTGSLICSVEVDGRLVAVRRITAVR